MNMFYFRTQVSVHFLKWTLHLDPCIESRCDYYAKCLVRPDRTTECVCPVCRGVEIAAVCGTNGLTYASRCHLEAASCQQKKNIYVAKDGPCG